MEKLSDAELYTWEFLEGNRGKVQLSSITQIAELAHVSTATVVRTVKKRGFDGYSDYKNSLKRGKAGEQQQRVKGLSEEANAFINKNIEELLQTIHLLDGSDLSKIVQDISKARTIMIIARGPSVSVAGDLAHRLQALGKHAVSRYYDNMSTYAEELTSADFLIAISVSGETQRILATVKNAQKKKVKTLAMTCNYHSTLTDVSDFVLRANKSKLEKERLIGDNASRMPLEFLCRMLLDLLVIYEEKGSISE